MQKINEKEQVNTRYMCTLTAKSCVHQEALREGNVTKEQVCTQCKVASTQKGKEEK